MAVISLHAFIRHQNQRKINTEPNPALTLIMKIQAPDMVVKKYFDSNKENKINTNRL